MEDAIEDADEDNNPDIRSSAIRRERRVEAEGELADSDDDDSDGEYLGSRTGATLTGRCSTRLFGHRRNIPDYRGNAMKPKLEPQSKPQPESETKSESETETERGSRSVSGTRRRSAASQSAYKPAPKKRVERKRGRRGSKGTGSKRITFGGKEFGVGCMECRRRHVLCGRQRPACSFCVKVHQATQCTYCNADGSIVSKPMLSEKKWRELEDAAAKVVRKFGARSAPFRGLTAPEMDSVSRKSMASEDPASAIVVALSASRSSSVRLCQQSTPSESPASLTSAPLSPTRTASVERLPTRKNNTAAQIQATGTKDYADSDDWEKLSDSKSEDDEDNDRVGTAGRRRRDSEWGDGL